jgi:ribosomal protein L11 methyltransferase
MRAFVVSVTPTDVEVASDLLWSLGVVAVEERSVGSGLIELWTSLGDDFDGVAFAAAAVSIDSATTWEWRFESVDESVADAWREFARPVTAAPGLEVRPAWITGVPEQDGITLLIEPGATFGLGDHPTTVLSLRALVGMIRPGDRVLDVGCGSGVLAIAALRLGAGTATGIDISPAAVTVTLENAARNGVDVDVSTTPLADVTGTFDVVVANILAPVLVDLADDLRRITGRVLIVSGVLEGGFDHVVAALAPMEVVDVETLDGWAAVLLRGCSPAA